MTDDREPIFDMYRDNWVNAREMSERVPDSFHVPSGRVLCSLEPGDMVKICNGEERFWVKLEEPYDMPGYWVGVVQNDLVNKTRGYDNGSYVLLHIDHVYQVHTNRFLERVMNELARGVPLSEISVYEEY